MRFILPKIKKYLSQKNLQRGVLFSVFLLVIFASTTHFAHAGILGAIGDAFLGAFNILLYAILQIMSWILSAVVALFGYAVDAGNLSGPNGMLNLQATYDMWKFVRDIINIAFIFGLLFIAFAFIFQIHGYSDTKVIFKLIIAALLVNFSFPLARVLIDFANVPMYFFLQMIMGNGGSGALDNALSASRLKDILVPDLSTAIHSETSVLLLNIIFMFMFAITILVLAIQLLIRMIALVILVILSPIGFAASGIPGLKKYGGKWWDSFLNYSLFGPAAAFMLVLATNFLAAVAGGDQYNGLKQLASKTSGGDTSMIAAMGVFAIPIVMLWFTIGMAGKFSVAGASIGKDYGQKFAKWTGKKVATPVTSRYKYAKKGVQKGMQKGNLFGVKYGDTRLGKYASGKYWDDKSARTEAAWTGRISGGSKGVKSEYEKLHDKKVAEEEKKMEEERTSESSLRGTMNSQKEDKAKREAAARILAKKEALRNGGDVREALDAIALANGAQLIDKNDPSKGINPDTLSDRAVEKQRELVKKAGGEIYKSGEELAAAVALLGNDIKGVSALVDKANPRTLETLAEINPESGQSFYQNIASIDSGLKAKLDSRLKKEGKRRVIIQGGIETAIAEEQNKKGGPLSQDEVATIRQNVYNKSLSGIKAKDIGNIEDIHDDKEFVNFVKNEINSGSWSEKDIQDAFAGLEGSDKKLWIKNKLYQSSSGKKAAPKNAADVVAAQKAAKQEPPKSPKPQSAADVMAAQRKNNQQNPPTS